MVPTDSDALVKIHVDLPNHWGTGGESLWACPIGDDLFELRNVPFFAYDLNFGDVVKATSDAPHLKPEIRAVLRRSGHRTLRVLFNDVVDKETSHKMLETLQSLGVTFEHSSGRHFALDVAREDGYVPTCNQLAAWEADGKLGYETCEARVAGSFDDKPDKELGATE